MRNDFDNESAWAGPDWWIYTELNLELSLLTGLKERRGPKLDSDPHKFHQVFFNVFPIRVAQFLKLTKQIPQMEHFKMF